MNKERHISDRVSYPIYVQSKYCTFKKTFTYSYITSTVFQIDRHVQQNCIQPPRTHSLDLEYQEFAWFGNL